MRAKIIPKERESRLPSNIESIILGIDPGLTTALVAIDLDGNLQEVYSSRELPISEALSFAMKYDVLVVASDVSPAPRFVEKISSSLDSVLFTPPHSMSVAEKIALVDEKFSKDAYTNAHERDAIAASIKAYNHYRNKLEQIDRKLEELNLAELRENVRRMVLKGVSIDRALKELTRVEEKIAEEKREYESIPDEYKGIIKTLKEEISLLRSERESLKEELEAASAKISELERRMQSIRSREFREIKKAREIEIREKEIQRLKSELLRERDARSRVEKKLRSLRKAGIMESENLALVKLLKNFSKEEIHALEKSFREGDVLYILDATGGGRVAAESLLKLRPRAIIVDEEKMSHLSRDALMGHILISPGSLGIKLLQEFALVNEELLRAEIEEKKKEVELEEKARIGKWLERFLEDYKKRKN